MLNVLSTYLKKRNKRMIWSSLKGYRILKNENRLDLLIKLKKEISETQIKSYPNKLLYNGSKNELNISIKQFLLTRLLHIDFNTKILISITKKNKKFYHPLPLEWRKVLDINGFKANNTINKLIWNGYLIMFFIYGIVSNLKRVYNSVKQIYFLSETLDISKSAYFYNLSKNNIVLRKGSDNIISWTDKYFIDKDLSFFLHSVKNIKTFKLNKRQVKFIQNIIPLPSTFYSLIKFINWGFYSFILSIFDFFRGRYFSFIMYNELSMSYLVDIAKKNQIPKKIFFHQTGYLFKPLWTSSLEKRESIVYLYFYATGIQSPDFKNSNGIQGVFYGHMSWKNYLVWDLYQKEFIGNITSCNSSIEVAGPINFISGLTPKINYKKSIALFDIQPFRDSFTKRLGNETEYYESNTAIKFLNDILDIANKHEFKVYHKRKRDISEQLVNGFSLNNNKYTNYLQKISKLKDNYYSLNPNTDPYYLIRDTELSISIPFTSTSVYAKSINKPTFYYDPTGLVRKNDVASHGIKVISKKKELAEWFDKNYIFSKRNNSIDLQ